MITHMGARGKQPTPTPLRVLRGARPARINGNEPTAPGEPTPPIPLSDAAREVRDALLPPLRTLGIVGAADGLALAMLCDAVADYQKYRRIVDRAPLIKDKDDHWRRNPATFLLERAADRIARWAPQFGLTPSARVGLHSPSHIGQLADAERLLS
jgi:P27 family predicted phage terminase small subunit